MSDFFCVQGAATRIRSRIWGVPENEPAAIIHAAQPAAIRGMPSIQCIVASSPRLLGASYPVFLNFSSQLIFAVSCIIAQRVMTAPIVTVSPV